MSTTTTADFLALDFDDGRDSYSIAVRRADLVELLDQSVGHINDLDLRRVATTVAGELGRRLHAAGLLQPEDEKPDINGELLFKLLRGLLDLSDARLAIPASPSDADVAVGASFGLNVLQDTGPPVGQIAAL